MSRLPLIDNGSVKPSGGVRRIVVSPDSEIRDVVKATRCAPRDRQCTHQRIHEGDYILEVTWWPEVERAYVWKDGDQVEISVDDVTGLYDGLSNVIKDWLNPVEGEATPSFLPDGYGWRDGLALADIAKRNYAAEFFAGVDADWLAALLPVVQASAKDGLRYDWRRAAPLPAALDAPRNTRLVPGEPGIDVRTEWALWYYDGSVVVIAPAPTSGVQSSVDPRVARITHSAPAIAMPVHAFRAARITYGCYTRRNGRESYGVKWDLFAACGLLTVDIGHMADDPNNPDVYWIGDRY